MLTNNAIKLNQKFLENIFTSTTQYEDERYGTIKIAKFSSYLDAISALRWFILGRFLIIDEPDTNKRGRDLGVLGIS